MKAKTLVGFMGMVIAFRFVSEYIFSTWGWDVLAHMAGILFFTLVLVIALIHHKDARHADKARGRNHPNQR